MGCAFAAAAPASHATHYRINTLVKPSATASKNTLSPSGRRARARAVSRLVASLANFGGQLVPVWAKAPFAGADHFTRPLSPPISPPGWARRRISGQERATPGPSTPPGTCPSVPGHRRPGAGNFPAQWPGQNGKVIYSEGLDIGYRYYNDHNLCPLFPFGSGLRYTSFCCRARRSPRPRGVPTVGARVANTLRAPVGHRRRPQAYLSYPPAVGEPPAQLRAFARDPWGQDNPRSSPWTYQGAISKLRGRAFRHRPGTYTLSIGQSSDDFSPAQPDSPWQQA